MHTGGVSTKETHYLGTFIFRAAAEARGAFTVTVTLDEENTYLLSPTGQVIDLNPEAQ